MEIKVDLKEKKMVILKIYYNEEYSHGIVQIDHILIDNPKHDVFGKEPFVRVIGYLRGYIETVIVEKFFNDTTPRWRFNDIRFKSLNKLEELGIEFYNE